MKAKHDVLTRTIRQGAAESLKTVKTHIHRPMRPHRNTFDEKISRAPGTSAQKTQQPATMPREHKAKRGRREENKGEKKLKRKRERDEDEAPRYKKQRSHDPADEDVLITGTDNAEVPPEEEEGGATERPFYGMLEDEEQEYFRRADELLELNDFPSEEERSLFLASVYREADGKELKIACSQSCSRLME
jgi:hypothetical protein